eukprot:COSAG05_NODE_5620_length_1128_cov_1.985423_1_plen_221_part_00
MAVTQTVTLSGLFQGSMQQPATWTAHHITGWAGRHIGCYEVGSAGSTICTHAPAGALALRHILLGVHIFDPLRICVMKRVKYGRRAYVTTGESDARSEIDLYLEAAGTPAARLAQVEQVVEDAMDDERVDISVQMWQQMNAGPITLKFEELAKVMQGIVLTHVEYRIKGSTRCSCSSSHQRDRGIQESTGRESATCRGRERQVARAPGWLRRWPRRVRTG